MAEQVILVQPNSSRTSLTLQYATYTDALLNQAALENLIEASVMKPYGGPKCKFKV